MIGTLATWLVLFIFLSYLLPHLFVTWFFKVRPASLGCGAPEHMRRMLTPGLPPLCCRPRT